MSTRAEDRITLAIIAWLIAGLFIDGYAHTNIIDTATEDFFTPWHGIFYAAFISLAGWIGWVGYKRRSAAPILDWFPAGYRASVYGLAIFAVGGIGDGIWHTIFGVEVGIDALLSPTHLILFTGSLLLIWTPVRAAAARREPLPGLALGSAMLTTALLVFFVEYIFFLSETWITSVPFDPDTNGNWQYVSVFLAASVVQVAVLLGPLLLIVRRWQLPIGTATIIWGFAAALEMSAFDQDWSGVHSLVVGGLVFDLVNRFWPGPEHRLAAAAFLGPAAAFATYFLLALGADGVNWPPEIWGGAIMMAGFTGIGLVAVQSSGRHTLVDAA